MSTPFCYEKPYTPVQPYEALLYTRGRLSCFSFVVTILPAVALISDLLGVEVCAIHVARPRWPQRRPFMLVLFAQQESVHTIGASKRTNHFETKGFHLVFHVIFFPFDSPSSQKN